jgi:pimeloyl-ACP methyl ester carboxylesterase
MPMQRAAIDGVELEYELRGSGDPVVLIHAGLVAGFFRPLMGLADSHTVLRYHRPGYAGSGRVEGELSFQRQAALCHGLMRDAGIERAHLVGHSSSACMALQLALDAPGAVQSLALLDAARPAVPGPLQQETVKAYLEPSLERFQAGDAPGAVDVWMRGVCGPGYREPLGRALPDAFDQAVADAPTFFGQELGAVRAWTFTREDAARVVQPVLAVLGENSRAVFRERRDLLLDWLPNAERFSLPGATHLLQVENPDAMTSGLAAFFARHPLVTTASN